jgi:hypothetical protein
VLATKFGLVSHRDGNAAPETVDSSPASVRVAVEGSLRRLNVDHIDLYYQHRVDPPDVDRRHRRSAGGAGAGGQGLVHRAFRGGAGHRPAGARGASGGGVAGRILAVDTRSGGRAPASHGGTGHRLRPVLATGTWLLDRSDPLTSRLGPQRLSQPDPPLLRRELRSESAHRQRGARRRGGAGRHAGPDRAGVAVGAERPHRADPGNETNRAARGERGRGLDRAEPGSAGAIERHPPRRATATPTCPTSTARRRTARRRTSPGSRARRPASG